MKRSIRSVLRAAVGLVLADTLRKQGNAVEYFEIPTDGGHIDGVTQIGLAAKPIAAFLAAP